MTTKQNSLYWREWGALVRYCKRHNLPAPDRHSMHMAALGADRSHLAFTNQDFDRVLAEFRAHSRPEDLDAQLRQIDQPRIRLKYAVKALAPAAAYWSKIARDKFGTDDLDALSIEQLTQLRNTLADRRRAQHRRERAGDVRDTTSLSVDRSLRGAGPAMAAAGPVSAAS
jgi:hypothetical protein